MAFKKLFVIVFFAAVLVACGDDDASNPVNNSDEDSSSSVCEDCDGSSSSKAKSSSSGSILVEYVDPSTVVKGTMTDERDGLTYKTVTIGTQTWMAENLNYAYTKAPFHYNGMTSDSISWCYFDKSENCVKYGRLYTWAAAMDSVGEWSTNGKGCGEGKTCSPTYPVRGICPEGWHLPDSTEWNMLFTAVGGRLTAGKMLKSASGWNSSGNGTDSYSFTALSAASRDYVGWSSEGDGVLFWSSTETDRYRAYSISLIYYSNFTYQRDNYKYNGFSVRCLKDE
jgi:uncharacterized protein (TIGR02145 family)